MPLSQGFILGEFLRRLDERHRLSIPSELVEIIAAESASLVLAKQLPGCLSLWSDARWQTQLDERVGLVEQKVKAGVLQDQLGQVQLLGRLLSTRHKAVSLASGGRLLIPEGFREFLGVEPGGEVLVVGAAVCLEIWHPPAWVKHLRRRIPRFRRLLDQLAK